jgi:hypothetical protein
MLDLSTHIPARLPADTPPLLVVVVDTEEEFDWAKPVNPGSTGVRSIRHQVRAHRIFEKFGIRPTYVIDYPVASQRDGYGPLAELRADGLCEIGAHLHPWVNPPHDEVVNAFNSYPGNLPPELEHEKLAELTAAIEDGFGLHPVVYKAGRYGVGPNTTETLKALNYRVDASVVPQTDFRADDGGPDFRACGPQPYWFGGSKPLLEIPLSTCFTGALHGAGTWLRPLLTKDLGMKLRLPGIFARLSLLERLRLSPEGIDHDEHRRLTKAMLRRGQKVFSFTYHSPSLDVGHTPYVQSQTDLDRFLDRFERYFEFFMGEIGGRAATPLEVLDLVSREAKAG